MRKFITFLLVAATVALSLLTAIMMLSATDIFPLPSDFQESAASIISRITVVLAEAVLITGLCVATHFLIKKRKSLSSRGQNFVRSMVVSHRRVHHIPVRRI